MGEDVVGDVQAIGNLKDLAAVFLARGVVGYTPWWAEKTPEPNFRLNDARVYSPLCLFLGLGFIALVILRLL